MLAGTDEVSLRGFCPRRTQQIKGGITWRMHKFWTVSDPMMAQIQMVMLMKNVSMLGSALLITQFGAGPFSLDARRSR
jgi:uncharacterized membrane protein YphA (DoxX/SURF4 family)